VLFGASAASADVFTDYTINFTGGSPKPTAGSFTYDETNPQFSSFFVTWDGLTFDLTSSANAPGTSPPLPACIGGTLDAEASFDALSSDCSGEQSWSAGTSGGSPVFNFFVDAPPNNPFEIHGNLSGFTGPDAGASGGLTISPVVAPVPEPTSTILLATVLAMASFLARKRFGQRRHAAIE
jgi:hypothetical protein